MPSIDDLVGVAHEGGYKRATSDTIRYWQRQGFLSDPVARKGELRYPFAALAEVDVLTRWGRRHHSRDVLTVARYVEAGTGAPELVREACLRVLAQWQREADELTARIAEDPGLIRREAEKVARARGKNALLPREVRGLSLRDRTEAHEFVLNAMLGVELDERSMSDGSRQVARTLGLLSGRGGKDRDVSEILPSKEDWRIDLHDLARAVREGSTAQMAVARRGAEAGFLWLPALLSFHYAEAAPADAPALRVGQVMASKFEPELYVVMLAHSLAGPVSKLTPSQLRDALSEPDLAVGAAAFVLEQADPEGPRRILLRELRPYQREKLKLALFASADGGARPASARSDDESVAGSD